MLCLKKKKILFNSKSVFGDKKCLWNASYENLQEKYFQTGDLFLLEPELVKYNVVICSKPEENNTKIRSTAFNRQLTEFSKYKKLNREATVSRKLNLKDWFATKRNPKRISCIQCDVKKNGLSCMIVLSTHS